MSPTRRSFLVATGVAAATGSLLRPRLTHAMQATPQATFTPIRRNVGFFTMRGGTIGWLVNSDAVVAVDSQFPAEAAACLAGLDERSGGRQVEALVNTHHHGDHSGGNASFRGRVGRVVAHRMADEHMRNPPAGQPADDQLFPDTTFTDSWSGDVGDERVRDLEIRLAASRSTARSGSRERGSR